MGYAKQQMIQMEEEWSNGYVTPTGNKDVCGCHFHNCYLSKYIKDNGRNGKCSYCCKNTKVIEFRNFMDYVGNRLIEYLGPMDNEGLFLASSFYDKEDDDIPGFVKRGPFILPDDVEYYEDVSEVMEAFDLNTDNDCLNGDIKNCFYVNNWIRRDPTALLMKDEWLFLWKNFARLVKTKSRYTFFRNEEYYTDANGYKHEGHDIIQEITNMVKHLEGIVPCGEKIYRGRPEDNSSPFTKFEELTAPPMNLAKNNRMSPQGISMFYGAFDCDTPKKEILNYLGGKSKRVYVGEFETTRDIKVVNLCNIPKPDFWMEDKDDWQICAFLNAFHNEISKPIGMTDDELEYIPSQVFSEYLRLIQKSNDDSPFDGIIYQSSLTRNKNIVLFCDNESSADVLKLKKVTIG